MPTARSLHDQLVNALDFLVDADLALYPKDLAFDRDRVGWRDYGHSPFIFAENSATVRQYLDWVSGGHYSLLLADASLLQITYRFEGARVIGHRLAYVPCPVIIDSDLLDAGEPVADIVEAQVHDATDSTIQLRSVIRFDYAPLEAGVNHPASHVTVNSATCRIGCVAPVHPYQFIDFVFRNFYPELHVKAPDWFAIAASRRLTPRLVSDGFAARPHLAWSH